MRGDPGLVITGAHTADTPCPKGTHGVETGWHQRVYCNVVAHTPGRTVMKKELENYVCKGCASPATSAVASTEVYVLNTSLDDPCPHHFRTGSSPDV